MFILCFIILAIIVSNVSSKFSFVCGIRNN